MRIQIRLYHPDADRIPIFLFDADPYADPDPSFKKMAETPEIVLYSIHFGLHLSAN
jgi:hypothetical protein